MRSVLRSSRSNLLTNSIISFYALAKALGCHHIDYVDEITQHHVVLHIQQTDTLKQPNLLMVILQHCIIENISITHDLVYHTWLSRKKLTVAHSWVVLKYCSITKNRIWKQSNKNTNTFTHNYRLCLNNRSCCYHVLEYVSYLRHYCKSFIQKGNIKTFFWYLFKKTKLLKPFYKFGSFFNLTFILEVVYASVCKMSTPFGHLFPGFESYHHHKCHKHKNSKMFQGPMLSFKINSLWLLIKLPCL